jgi:hypothetical protein
MAKPILLSAAIIRGSPHYRRQVGVFLAASAAGSAGGTRIDTVDLLGHDAAVCR